MKMSLKAYGMLSQTTLMNKHKISLGSFMLKTETISNFSHLCREILLIQGYPL